MSAPSTNVETQKRRHWWPLYVIVACLLFGVVMFLTIFTEATDDDVTESNAAAATASDGN